MIVASRRANVWNSHSEIFSPMVVGGISGSSVSCSVGIPCDIDEITNHHNEEQMVAYGNKVHLIRGSNPSLLVNFPSDVYETKKLEASHLKKTRRPFTKMKMVDQKTPQVDSQGWSELKYINFFPVESRDPHPSICGSRWSGGAIKVIRAHTEVEKRDVDRPSRKEATNTRQPDKVPEHRFRCILQIQETQQPKTAPSQHSDDR